VTAGLAERIAAALDGPAAGALDALRAAAPGERPDPRPVFRCLGARGLLAPSWPVRYGGAGGTPADLAALVEALVRAGVPETLHTLSVQIVGTLLLSAGTDTQRAEHLPALAAGDRSATVLYTELDAGSDLAALSTEASPDGDGWRVTGRKVFSVCTELADVGLCLARTGTGTRYQGLTLFLVPLDADGVRVEVLDGLADEPFCDVLLDRVRVGPEAVVGPVDGAWGLLADALAIERTGVDYQAKARRWLELAVAERVAAGGGAGGWTGSETGGGAGTVGDADLATIGRLDAQAQTARLLSGDVLDRLGTGDPIDPADAAVAKWYASETARRVAWWAVEAAGLAGCLPAGEPGAALAGRCDPVYRELPGLTISAGTSEMMLQTIAGSALAAGDGS
jgi:alkylation response protein AidB-like acyl-CoA dehydrogenase